MVAEYMVCFSDSFEVVEITSYSCYVTGTTFLSSLVVNTGIPDLVNLILVLK